MTLRLGLTALLLLGMLPPSVASAAPKPDRVIDEVSAPIDVAVDGSLIAYTRRVGTRGVEVVVRNGDRPTVRLAGGRGTSPVDVGRDRRGQPVVVFVRCGGSCDLVAFSMTTLRSRVVLRGVARATDLALGAGRVFWADGRQVRSRALDGGSTRREAVVAQMKPTELDTDGTTLAVTGDLPGEFDGGASGLSITRVGSGKARLRARRNYSQEYTAIRDPAVTRSGVTTLFETFTPGTADTFLDFAAGKRGVQERTTGGMQILTWAVDGANAVLVEAPTDVGCGIGRAFSEQLVRRVPCRIVLADVSRERLLPPRIAIAGRTASVLRTALDGAKVTGRVAQPGVTVEVRSSAKLIASLVTDAQGRVTLPENDEDTILAVEAATSPPSYTAYGG